MADTEIKSPAFQFYPDNWFGSSKVRTMTPAHRGCYIQLLATAWLEPDCGLPDDDDELASLSGAGVDWVNLKDKVRKCFYAENGRLFNARLLAERKKQDAYRAERSASGQRGAQNRWGKSESGRGSAPSGSTNGQSSGSARGNSASQNDGRSNSLANGSANSSAITKPPDSQWQKMALLISSSSLSLTSDLNSAKRSAGAREGVRESEPGAITLGDLQQAAGITPEQAMELFVDIVVVRLQDGEHRRIWWRTVYRNAMRSDDALNAGWSALDEAMKPGSTLGPRWVSAAFRDAGVKLPAEPKVEA